MTGNKTVLVTPERPAGQAGRTDLPFPFYDFTDWFFQPMEKHSRPTPAVVPGFRGSAAIVLFKLARFIVRRGPGSEELSRDWEAVLTESQQSDIVRNAAGMVRTALSQRVDHLVETCWSPVDRVLASRTLSNVFVLGPSAAAAWFLFRAGGGTGLLGHAEAVAAIGALLHHLVAAGRKWRDVEPPEHKRRRPHR